MRNRGVKCWPHHSQWEFCHCLQWWPEFHPCCLRHGEWLLFVHIFQALGGKWNRNKSISHQKCRFHLVLSVSGSINSGQTLICVFDSDFCYSFVFQQGWLCRGCLDGLSRWNNLKCTAFSEDESIPHIDPGLDRLSAAHSNKAWNQIGLVPDTTLTSSLWLSAPRETEQRNQQGDQWKSWLDNIKEQLGPCPHREKKVARIPWAGWAISEALPTLQFRITWGDPLSDGHCQWKKLAGKKQADKEK